MIDKGSVPFLHLQTAILCLVCEACKAGRQHESPTESPLNHLGPETIHTNGLPVQKGVLPAWPEKALLDIPAVSVIYMYIRKKEKKKNFILVKYIQPKS